MKEELLTNVRIRDNVICFDCGDSTFLYVDKCSKNTQLFSWTIESLEEFIDVWRAVYIFMDIETDELQRDSRFDEVEEGIRYSTKNMRHLLFEDVNDLYWRLKLDGLSSAKLREPDRETKAQKYVIQGQTWRTSAGEFLSLHEVAFIGHIISAMDNDWMFSPGWVNELYLTEKMSLGVIEYEVHRQADEDTHMFDIERLLAELRLEDMTEELTVKIEREGEITEQIYEFVVDEVNSLVNEYMAKRQKVRREEGLHHPIVHVPGR